MNSLAFPTTEARILTRKVFIALACSVALAACTHKGSVGVAPGDAAPDVPDAPISGIVLPDAGPAIDTAGCSLYPLTSREGSTGPAWYWWYFHWDAIGDLRGFCASYGDGAKMVLEVVDPRNSAPSTALPPCASDEISRGGTRACVVPDSYRFEVDCTAGGLLFELPSDRAFTGYYHVESAQVPGAARHAVVQDPNCARDVYITGGPEQGAIDAGISDGMTIDAGPDRAEAGGDIPTGGSCGSIVTHCAATPCKGDCSMGELAETTNPIIHACGGFCGYLNVGFSGGCATVVEGISNLQQGGPSPAEGLVACVEHYFFSHRFDCVPADGRVGLYVDDCLLP